MIEFNAVSKSYIKDIQALTDVTLTVKNGEIFAFLGKNGAGKTTAIQLLTGQSSIDAGKVLIDSIDIADNPIEAKKRLSLVGDDSVMNDKLTGLEHLRFYAQMYDVDKKTASDRINQYAELFSMRELLPSLIKSYSSGMKQKLRIIAALISNPHNLVLDEPLNGLDPDAVFVLKEIIKERAASGKTVFFSTHIMDVAEKLCTQIGILHKGVLLYSGTIEQLRKIYEQQRNVHKNADLETIFFSFIKENV